MNREFFQPETLNEALEYRRDHEGSALLAGGTDLIVSIHKDKGPMENIIDLSRIINLKEIQIVGDDIIIGPMVTFAAIEGSQILNDRAKILCTAAGTVGSPQIRNRGTIGGNICNASPASDGIPPLVALEASVELKSMDTDGLIKTRIMALQDFIIGSSKTLLKNDEILTNIIFKLPPYGANMNFSKIGRRNALAISRVNGACILKMENNIVSMIKLVIGSVTSKPERFRTVEDYLTGRNLNDEVLEKAGSLASDYVLKQTGMRSSSAYKLPVVARFTSSLIEETSKKEE